MWNVESSYNKCNNCGKPFEPKGDQNVCSIECFMLRPVYGLVRGEASAKVWCRSREKEGWLDTMESPEPSEVVSFEDITHLWRETDYEGLSRRIDDSFEWNTLLDWRSVTGPIEELTLAEEVFVTTDR